MSGADVEPAALAHFGLLAPAPAGRFRSRPAAGDEPLALRALACKFPGPANGLSGFARPLLGRLFVSAAAFHFAEDAFALQFLFQDPKGLINIVVSN